MPGVGTKRGAVLLAHGSRDRSAGVEAGRLCRELASANPEWRFQAAYLKGSPSLSEAVERLAARGCQAISVLPLLVFSGRHVREHIPALVAAEKSRRPGLRIELMPHLGRLPGFPAMIAKVLTGSAEAE